MSKNMHNTNDTNVRYGINVRYASLLSMNELEQYELNMNKPEIRVYNKDASNNKGEK